MAATAEGVGGSSRGCGHRGGELGTILRNLVMKGRREGNRWWRNWLIFFFLFLFFMRKDRMQREQWKTSEGLGFSLVEVQLRCGI